jgi:ElaB/YqjD/DUF883 family membrane-anchored ribosome-binding protein
MMFSRKSNDNGSTRPVSSAAGSAIREAQRGATAVVDQLADGAQALQQQGSDVVERTTQRFDTLAHQGAQLLQDRAQRVLDRAHDASHQTRDYIESQPLKSVLMAAAAGAALMALATLLVRSGRRA